MNKFPSFDFEKALQEEGFNIIAGIDEVGRGAWAGPVTAAAVIFDHQKKIEDLDEVRDSKLLTPKKRQELSKLIYKKAKAVGIGSVSHQEIDKVGIKEATLRAMRLAIKNLEINPEYLLVDAIEIEKVTLPQKNIIKGDQKVFSISAASIVAKVSRDQEMIKLHKTYPDYGFDQHKGYGVKKHREALREFGICSIHRQSYKPVATHCNVWRDHV